MCVCVFHVKPLGFSLLCNFGQCVTVRCLIQLALHAPTHTHTHTAPPRPYTACTPHPHTHTRRHPPPPHPDSRTHTHTHTHTTHTHTHTHTLTHTHSIDWRTCVAETADGPVPSLRLSGAKHIVIPSSFLSFS